MLSPRLLSLDDLRKLGIRYGQKQLGRLERKGGFPRRVKLDDSPSSRIAWVESEVKKWLDDRLATRG
jgi:predicted DNA-binding transcriptional regulator AlpA